MSKQPKWMQGFTLVEVMVTVAIIALLLGILVPTLSSARAQSKLAVCRVNLKSIGELVAAYAQVNDNRIPRGPSHLIYNGGNSPLLMPSPYVATNMIWMASGFDDKLDVPRPPQYVGLGMLLKSAGEEGNEFLFCPADDRDEFDEEAAKIGRPGADLNTDSAYGSYLYRQLDMLAPHVSGEYNDPDSQGQGRLDGLDYNEDFSKTFRVDVMALALDRNSTDPSGNVNRQTNHNEKKVNVVYVDGSTNSFDNNAHMIPDGVNTFIGAGLWASIPDKAFFPPPPPPDSLDGIMGELDRIFMAADFSYIGDPARAYRIPVFPPYP